MRPHRGVLSSPGVYLDNLHYHCENRQTQTHNSTLGISTTAFSDRKIIYIVSIKPIMEYRNILYNDGIRQNMLLTATG